MKELNIEDMEIISGGLQPPSNIHPFMDVRIALTTFKGMGLVGAAFGVGYAAGQWLNENTPIQDWVAKGIDSIAGTNYNDPAGKPQ